jgi:hypothetical protein
LIWRAGGWTAPFWEGRPDGGKVPNWWRTLACPEDVWGSLKSTSASEICLDREKDQKLGTIHRVTSTWSRDSWGVNCFLATL